MKERERGKEKERRDGGGGEIGWKILLATLKKAILQNEPLPQ